MLTIFCKSMQKLFSFLKLGKNIAAFCKFSVNVWRINKRNAVGILVYCYITNAKNTAKRIWLLETIGVDTATFRYDLQEILEKMKIVQNTSRAKNAWFNDSVHASRIGARRAASCADASRDAASTSVLSRISIRLDPRTYEAAIVNTPQSATGE